MLRKEKQQALPSHPQPDSSGIPAQNSAAAPQEPQPSLRAPLTRLPPDAALGRTAAPPGGRLGPALRHLTAEHRAEGTPGTPRERRKPSPLRRHPPTQPAPASPRLAPPAGTDLRGSGGGVAASASSRAPLPAALAPPRRQVRAPSSPHARRGARRRRDRRRLPPSRDGELRGGGEGARPPPSREQVRRGRRPARGRR